MRHDGNDLTEALSLIDMESLLDREGIEYKTARGARGLQINVKECPCCGNSNWKVFLNAESGLGNCFHGDCEEKFNKWKFIKATLGSLSNKDLVAYIKSLAQEMGWRPAVRERVESRAIPKKLSIPDAISLPYNGKNLKYLNNRNITAEVAHYFHLMFSLNGKFEFGGEGGKRLFQDYSNRVIVPIFNLEGEMVSFQGRDITGMAEKKYLFPPEFSATGSVLYNGQNAIGAKSVVIGEGVFDVMAIKIALDQDIALREVVPVGSFGKHLSEGGEDSQMAKLRCLQKQGLEKVTVMWDGERVALQDAANTALKISALGIKTLVAVLPFGKDPNEVPPSVVRSAYREAIAVNRLSMARLKLSALEMKL